MWMQITQGEDKYLRSKMFATRVGNCRHWLQVLCSQRWYGSSLIRSSSKKVKFYRCLIRKHDMAYLGNEGIAPRIFLSSMLSVWRLCLFDGIWINMWHWIRRGSVYSRGEKLPGTHCTSSENSSRTSRRLKMKSLCSFVTSETHYAVMMRLIPSHKNWVNNHIALKTSRAA